MNSLQANSEAVQVPVKPIQILSIELDEDQTQTNLLRVNKDQLESVYLTVKRLAIRISSIENLSELSIEDVDQFGSTLFNAQSNLLSLLEGKEIAR